MIGPLLSIVDTRPLESEQNRVISIAVVYLIWAQSHILPRLYNARLNRKLMDKLNENTTSPEAADPQKRLNSEEQILAGRFDEAAQMLKSPLQQSGTWRAVDAALQHAVPLSAAVVRHYWRAGFR